MRALLACAVLTLTACADKELRTPFAISNNAVAYHAPTETVYSFAGLKAGKTHHDVSADAFACDLTSQTCEVISPLPDKVGRLAATAKTVGDIIYIFGGYSVAEDGSETSTPEVFAYNVKLGRYQRKSDMPMPVDDTVSLVYKDRFIYLVSGWHKDGNVVNVQLYDTQTDAWEPATDWPGAPVFGHAGGIVENVIAVCDGVIVKQPVPPETKRSFTDISACWRGDIDVNDPTQITWRRLKQLPGKGHYRMAATGWPVKNMIVFAGGSDNPYNINGIGYDDEPSAPSAHVWAYDITKDDYILFKDKPIPTMDHRGLIHLERNKFITVGGMGKDQNVLARVSTFAINR
ncbi:MAG: galactose oxidase [Acidimicrobiales bacterium]|nr:galactose oxidase [Hyphomonadaceae bacterium]RZV40132.1 MAG: galactose oxidase [Acidimicrobiales bacterium]